jgi:transcriptional regulator with XRE-family HTH domain
MASPRGKNESTRAEALGARVRTLRRGRGETIDQLAGRIPMSPSNLSRLELGKQGPPSDETIERVAAALKVDAQKLLQVAGRFPGGHALQQEILRRLETLESEIREIRKTLGSRSSMS